MLALVLAGVAEVALELLSKDRQLLQVLVVLGGFAVPEQRQPAVLLLLIFLAVAGAPKMQLRGQVTGAVGVVLAVGKALRDLPEALLMVPQGEAAVAEELQQQVPALPR
jgi:hypothetical protein